VIAARNHSQMVLNLHAHCPSQTSTLGVSRNFGSGGVLVRASEFAGFGGGVRAFAVSMKCEGSIQFFARHCLSCTTCNCFRCLGLYGL
jgi:hypothetical protein